MNVIQKKDRVVCVCVAHTPPSTHSAAPAVISWRMYSPG